MNKFITPVSMGVTEEQFDYLSLELNKLGYNNNGVVF